jgi:26S proteasome regulatory subunit N9
MAGGSRWLESAAASARAAGEAPSAEALDELRRCFDRRLYHQFTLALEDALRSGALAGARLHELYDNVVTEIDTKLDALRLTKVAVTVSRALPADKAATFLDGVVARVVHCAHGGAQDAEMAALYVRMALAHLQLQGGRVGECRRAVEDAVAQLEPLAGVDPAVSAAVHWVASQLAKAERKFADFYRAALMYLSFVNFEVEMSAAEVRALGVDLCLAALLGEDVYSFGELLEHPIVKTVESTEDAWLVALLRAFNDGDAAQYDALCVEHGPKMNAQPALVAHERALREKVTIMSLLALAFRLPPDARTLPLATVAERTRLDASGVEFLLMKALSLGLVRGTIDQVSGTVEITWVTPRVLTTAEMASLGERLGTWLDKVDATRTTLEADGAAELIGV